MKSFESVIHKGKRLCIVDISNSQPQDAVTVLKESQNQISKLISKTALIVTDVSNTVYNKDSAAAFKEFAIRNTHYIQASAVVGADSIRAFLLKIVAVLTGRDIKSFKTRNEALDWLATK
jgi:hypothetical protein